MVAQRRINAVTRCCVWTNEWMKQSSSYLRATLTCTPTSPSSITRALALPSVVKLQRIAGRNQARTSQTPPSTCLTDTFFHQLLQWSILADLLHHTCVTQQPAPFPGASCMLWIAVVCYSTNSWNLAAVVSLIRVLAKLQQYKILSIANRPKCGVHGLNLSASCIKYYIWTTSSNTVIHMSL